MPTSNTPVTITSSAPVTIGSGTIISTGGPAVINAYAAGQVVTFTNAGTVESSNADDAGINLKIGGSTAGLASITNYGLVQGDGFGIFLTTGAASSTYVTINNTGTIQATHAGEGTRQIYAGIFTTADVNAIISNSGLIDGPTGIFLQSENNTTQTVINEAGGVITADFKSGPGNYFYGVKIQDIPNGQLIGAGDIINAGTINGLVDIAAASATVVNSGDMTQGFVALGSGELILEAGQTLSGRAQFLNLGGNEQGTTLLSVITLASGQVTVGTIADPSLYVGFGSLAVAAGADWSVGASGTGSTFNTIPDISNFGTLDIGGPLATNTGGVLSATSIDMEGSLGASSVVDFTGSDTSAPLYDYNSGDQIIISTLAAGPGDSYLDSYNTATGVLTITELDPSGNTIGSAQVSVTGTTPLTSADFVNVNGPGGDTIVLGTSPIVNSGSVFIDFGDEVTLSPATTVDTDPVTFGVHGAGTALNVLDLNSNPPGASSIPLTGQISGFGLNDDIVLGPALGNFQPGDFVTFYPDFGGNPGVIAIEDETATNASGSFAGSAITFVPGSILDPSQLVVLFGTNGLNIETPATVEDQSFVFSIAGTGSFYNPADYVGGIEPGVGAAPNISLLPDETVTIANGTATIDPGAPLTNNGTIIDAGSTAAFIDSTALGGNGTIDIDGGATVTLANTTGTDTGTYAFDNSGTATDPNLLNLETPGTAGFAGTIANFGTFDTIVLGATVLPTPTDASDIGLSFDPTTGILTVTDTAGGSISTDTLTFSGAIPGNFTASIGPDGILIADVPCFAAGTRIQTPSGQKTVESLAIGDEVLTTRDGSAQKIIWAGSRTIDLARHPNPEKVRPVRIAAGAFADGLPQRDLVVSPDHALFIDGHLIEAKTLINGATIIQDKQAGSVTYHHIELARHDVLLAEGLPAETYLDSGNRGNFADEAGPVALHPDFAAKSREAACAPLLLEGDIVNATRVWLLNRAHALGFTATDAMDLTISANGQTLTPEPGTDSGEILVTLPANARIVQLASSTGVPAELAANPADRRELGAAITGITLIANGKRTAIALDSDALTGFHAAEPGHRWTTGRASIALPAYSGRAVLEITTNGQAKRWATNPMRATA